MGRICKRRREEKGKTVYKILCNIECFTEKSVGRRPRSTGCIYHMFCNGSFLHYRCKSTSHHLAWEGKSKHLSSLLKSFAERPGEN